MTAPTDLDWWDRAACQGIDVTLFYPEKGGHYDAAQRVCADCTVRQQCLDYAMEREAGLWDDLRGGVWGGLTPRERAALAREHADG